MSKKPQQPVMEGRGLYKTFEDFRLQDVEITVFPGEVHVLVGENGSGKSTLMKLLSGWFSQDRGDIILEGRRRRFKSINEARKSGVVYLHQDVQSFGNLSVAENVYFCQLSRLGCVPGLVNREQVIYNCTKVFEELDVSIDPQSRLGDLGYAERQVVAAVHGYVTDARVVIFDEPSSAMSELDRDILFTIVSRLKDRGAGIFYVSHRMDEISRVGDRVTVMHQGRVLSTHSTRGVSRESLIRMMTGEVQKERYPRLEGRRGPVTLEVSNISLLPILKDVSFRLYKGEILGITGLMGSGRTLLANCLFGVVKPTQGRISLDGQELNVDSPEDAMTQGISLIPEDRAVNGIFSKHDVMRNMTSATLKRFEESGVLNDRYMRELTQEYIEELGIRPGRHDDIMGSYSGGNQQKAMVCRWLMNRSRIYIMDEPTRGIDAASKVDIYNAMNDMVDKGASILLISSEIEEILGMSDRVLVLAGGRIAAEMPREQATKAKILELATAE